MIKKPLLKDPHIFFVQEESLSKHDRELLLCGNSIHKRASVCILSSETNMENMNESNEFGLICSAVKWGIIYDW